MILGFAKYQTVSLKIIRAKQKSDIFTAFTAFCVQCPDDTLKLLCLATIENY